MVGGLAYVLGLNFVSMKCKRGACDIPLVKTLYNSS